MTYTDADHPRISDGTFTDKIQSAPETSLVSRPAGDIFHAKKGYGPGVWNIKSEQTDPTPENGFITIHVGGDPRVNTRIGAAARLYSGNERDAAQDLAHELAEKGSKMTILADRGGHITAHEVTGRSDSQGVAYFVKGSSRKYYPESALKILDVLPGYGQQDKLASRFDAKAVQVPVTDKATFEDIPDWGSNYPDGDSSIAAVFLIDGPDFGNGKEPGCMFFATDYQTGDDIVNGYFWAPSDAGLLTSESGSFYGRDLKHKSGRLRDYVPNSMTWSEATKIPDERAGGYAAVLGK